MQLNELLEEQSVKSISKQTRMSEQDISNLVAGNFDTLKRVKALGFISILEREYDVDMSELRKFAEDFYSDHGEDSSYVTELASPDEDGGGFSLWWLLAILVIGLGYYVTQIDKEVLNKYLPMLSTMVEGDGAEKKVTSSDDNKAEKDSSTKKAESIKEAVKKSTVETVAQKSLQEESTKKSNEATKEVENTKKNANTLYGVEVAEAVNESVSIIPKKRLWFGLVNMSTKKRKHFSVSKPYILELKGKQWLIATSTASFTLRDVKGDQVYKNAKSNYFKVDSTGTTKLSKKEYMALGGYRKW